jgi:hypothetical protein
MASNFLTRPLQFGRQFFGNFVAFSESVANPFPDKPPGKPLIERMPLIE